MAVKAGVYGGECVSEMNQLNGQVLERDLGSKGLNVVRKNAGKWEMLLPRLPLYGKPPWINAMSEM